MDRAPPGRPSPRSAPARRGRSPRMASPPTSSPSASSPSPWSRRWPRSRSPASASSSPAPPRPATSSPSTSSGRGAEVDVVALYETVREQPSPEAVEAAQSADYVTFTSSSTVRNLTEALGERFPKDARIVSIGPVTSEAATRRRPRGRRRSRAPRHRRPGRGPPRRHPSADFALSRPYGHKKTKSAERGVSVWEPSPALPGHRLDQQLALASWSKPAHRAAPWSPPANRPRGGGASGASGPRPKARRCSTRRSCARSTSATCCCRSRSRSRSAPPPRRSAPASSARSSGPTTSGSRAASWPES